MKKAIRTDCLINVIAQSGRSVNIIIGACIIKELLDLSDDEIVEGIMLDVRLQYALHTTSFEEQPLSDKSLTRFRTLLSLLQRNRHRPYTQLHCFSFRRDCPDHEDNRAYQTHGLHDDRCQHKEIKSFGTHLYMHCQPCEETFERRRR